jgi:hypothetical protein
LALASVSLITAEFCRCKRCRLCTENSDFEWRTSQMQQTSININKRHKCINPHALGTRECASVCLNSLHQSEGWSSHGTTARHWSQRWWWKRIYVIHWMRLQGRLGVLKLCPLRHFSGSKTSFQWAVSCLRLWSSLKPSFLIWDELINFNATWITCTDQIDRWRIPGNG